MFNLDPKFTLGFLKVFERLFKMPQASLKELKSGAHIHMMGICGTAMASLAGLLKSSGFKVTGSDANPYPPMSNQIESLGIKIQSPYQAQNLHPKPDFVIVGNVISRTNEEAQELEKLDLKFCSLPQAMGEFIIDQKNSFVVSGTHGKTTTSSLLSWLLDQSGFNPGFLIGGIPKNFTNSFRLTQSNTFVIEGDEYDTAYFDKVPKFIHYRPKQVILTSVEFDHADIYSDFSAVQKAFKRLADLIPEDGNLVYWGDDANVSKIALESKAKTHSYGFNSSNQFKIEMIKETSDGTEFSISNLGKFKSPMAGKYNVLNAAAALIISYLNQASVEKLRTALEQFQGVKRRQEILGEYGGVLIIEDFAHHPTAVKETVLAIQNRYAPKKVFSVFEPRSATSRRKVFQKDYVDAFSLAHESIIAEAFDQGKINEGDRFSSQDLVTDLTTLGHRSHVFKEVDQIVHYIKQNAQKNDVVLIMSNGGFGGIYQKLITTLSTQS